MTELKIIFNDKTVIELDPENRELECYEDDISEVIEYLDGIVESYKDMTINESDADIFTKYGYDLDSFEKDFNSIKWRVFWYDMDYEKTLNTVDAMDFNDAMEYKGSVIYTWFWWGHEDDRGFNRLDVREYREHTYVESDEDRRMLVWLVPEGYDEDNYKERIIN